MLLLGPALIRLVRRLNIGQNVRDEVPESHKGKAGTPTMGGVLILAAGIIAVLLFADLRNRQIQLGLLVAAPMSNLCASEMEELKGVLVQMGCTLA